MKRFLFILLTFYVGIAFGQYYQVGDLYIAPDGSKGIVYYIHPDGSGGWVVALNDASTGCAWGSSADIAGLPNQATSGTYPQMLTDTAGYDHTAVIRSEQNNNPQYAAGVVDFDHGWVLPSPAQLSMLCGQLPYITPALLAAGGTSMAATYYWCSAERSASNAWRVSFGIGNYLGQFNSTNKSNSCRVRAVRSFSYTTETPTPDLTYTWSTGDNTPDIIVTPEETTTYTVTVSTPGGCADTVAHTIVVNSAYHTGMLVTWCDEYEWNGQVYTEDGDYDQTFTAANGCDSVVTLHLTLNHGTHNSETATACESYDWHGITYTNSGAHTYEYINADGCPSTDTLHLTVNYGTHNVEMETACESYDWHGITYTNSVNYTYEYINADGCASTDTLHLTVIPMPALNHTLDTIIQAGTSATLWASGADYLYWTDGNDSLLYSGSALTINPLTTTTYYINGQNYSDGSNNLVSNGDFEQGNVGFISEYQALTSQYMSYGHYTITTDGHLHFLSSHLYGYNGTGQFMLVDGATTLNTVVWQQTVPVAPHTYYAFSAQVASAHHSNASGAYALLQFSVNSVQLGDIFHSPEVLNVWNPYYEVWYSGDNTSATLSILNQNTSLTGNDFGIDEISFSPLTDCSVIDSIVVTVLHCDTSHHTETVCESYLWYGDILSQSGDYTHTWPNESGCDSVVTLHLTVNHGTHDVETETACESFVWHGETLTTSGTYTYEYTNVDGCESTDTLHLTVNHATDSTLELVVLESSLPYMLNGEQYDSAGTYFQTLTNAAGCDSLLTVNLMVIPVVLPDNVDSADCTFLPEGTEWGIQTAWQSENIVSVLNTPMVGDLDGDGIPEIVCFALDGETGNPHCNNHLLVYDGGNKQMKASIVMPSYVSAFDASAYGLVRLPNGKGLIVVACFDFKLRAYDITAIDPSVPYWVSDIDYGESGHDWAVNVSFADFNHDGHPEVFVRNKVYNAETGALLAEANTSDHFGASYAHWSNMTHPYKLSSPLAADVCGDAKLELILGNEVYDVNITNTTGAAGNNISLLQRVSPPGNTPEDGHPQVADFNNDGYLDVFVSVRNTNETYGDVYGYVWDLANQTVSTPFVISTNWSGKSIPLVADIDNDSLMEVLIQSGVSWSSEKFQSYKYHPDTKTFTLEWGFPTDENSYSNSITAFDFNQDGLLELMISDQSTMRIVNGSGISHITRADTIPMYVLNSFTFEQNTIMQYPVIADVDADGSAEIVSVGDNRLVILKSTTSTPWAPARKVWNQYMYNVTNVNEDLTIPQYQFNNATAFTDPEGLVRRPFNNFLQQATTIDQYGRPFYAVPDVAVNSADLQDNGDSVMVTVNYCNTGDNTLNAPYSITVFANAYGGDAVGTATINESLPVDSCTQGYIQLPISSLCGFQSLDNLVIAVNCAGAGIAQNGGQQPECDTTNNTVSVAVTMHTDTTHLTASACDSYIWYGDTLTQSGIYTHTLTNAGGCDSVVVLDLTVNYPTDSTLAVVLLDSGLPFILNGESFDSAGTYTQMLTNATGCDSLLTIHLAVLPALLPDNVDSADCTFLPEGTEWGVQIGWSSSSIVHNRAIPLVGDLDNDGHPEIVCFMESATTHYSLDISRNDVILVYDGVTKALKNTLNLPSPVTTYDAAAYGLVKLPSGKGLIVVASYDLKLRAYDITAADPNVPYWVSDVNYGSVTGDWAVNLGFADVNHDGIPEVYVRDKIYNAVSGVLLATAPEGSNSGSSYCHWTHDTHWKLSSPIAADVWGDADLELILGNEIYETHITNTQGSDGNSLTLAKQITPPNDVTSDGNPQVADFNADGHPDIFISVRNTDGYYGTVYGYVWDVYNDTVSTPFVINTSWTGKSIPMIADIDNDGLLEVLIQCGVSGTSSRFRTYKYNSDLMNFSLMWSFSTDEDSYSNSITSFDFNQDGLLELMICDQSTMRIVNGSGKSHLTLNDTVPVYVMHSFPFVETTIMQYPVIADVDADGNAEIVSVGSHMLNIIESAGEPWAPARKVWNQYMYNVTNVNEDLTIPQYQFNNATAFTDPEGVVRRPFNNFLQQATTIDQYGRPFYAVPDVVVNSADLQDNGDSVMVTVNYCNTGDNTLNAPYSIAVFANAYGGDTVCTVTMHENLPVDSCTQGSIQLSLGALCGIPNLESLVVAVNCAGAGIAQNGGQQPECDTTNNTATVNVTLHADTTHLTASVCDSYIWYGDTLTQSGIYTHTLTNAGGCDSVVTLHLTIIPVPTLSHTPDTVIINGTSATLWASGADILYWTDGNDSILFSGNSLTVSPATATTYYLNGQNYNAVLEDNVVYNGDFEMGNAGFTSDYVYMANPSVLYEGEYYIGSNAHNCHPGFYNWNDHTTGSGNYMILNGAESPNTNVWTQTVTVTPNTDYAFSTWVCSVGGTPSIPTEQARLQFSVNGVQLGNIFTAPNAYGVWSRYYEVWNSGSDTSAVITILNQNTIAGGNDFGIDDIVFSPLTECSVTDSIRVAVIGYPDNVDSADCVFLPEGTEWGIGEPQISSTSVLTVTTPLVGDIDDDGQQEILIPSGDYKMYVFNADGTLKSQFSISGMYAGGPVGNVAIAKVRWENNLFKNIIVVFGSNKRLYAYDANGTLLWQSTQPFSNYNGEQHPLPTISFADFNHDGWTEIYVGSEIYDAATGVFLAKAEGNKGFAGRTWDVQANPYQTMAADLCGDYNLEVAIGNAVYTVDILSRTDASLNNMTAVRQVPSSLMVMEDNAAIPFTDGNTSLVDINKDGRLDVLVMNVDQSNRVVYCYVWDVETQSIICSKKIPNARKFGCPQIGDIDNDGNPEICFITGTYSNHNTGDNDLIYALKYNESNPSGEMDVFWATPHGDDSGCTGLTLFDFNQDGYAELVYRDIARLRIINGSLHHHQTGETLTQPYDLASFQCVCSTQLEYPIVVDVDKDGEAEIIVGGGNAGTWTNYGHLYIFKSSGEPWAPARKVWNQYMYNVTNVNEDLTIPQYLFDNATVFTDPEGVVRRPFNNFLQQATTIDQYGRPFYAVPDVAVNPSASFQLFGNDTVELEFTYCNIGDNTLNAPYTITVFANAYGGDTVCTVTMNESLPVDSCNQGDIRLTISSLCSFQSLDSLVIAVNCAGTGIAQNGGQQPECDTTNNTAMVSVTLHTDTTHLTASACDSYLWYGDTLTLSGEYTHTLTNTTGCDSVEVLTLTIIPVPVLTHTPDTVILAGDSATLWASGADYLYWTDSNDSLLSNGNSLTVSPESTTTYYLQANNNVDSISCSTHETIRVVVSEYPDNVQDVDCVFPPDSNAFEMVELFQYPNVNSMSTPMVADMDGDGLPEIIACCNTGSAPWYSTNFHVLNGQTGALKYDISTVQYRNAGQMMTIADVDHDGKSELFLMGRDRKIYCYNYNGGVRWSSANTVDNNYLLSATDVNNDGEAEIVCGKYIYNAQTGALLLEGTMVETGMGFGAPHSVDSYHPPYYMYALGDVDGDGTPELCAGNTVYKMQIVNPSGTTGNSWSILRQATLPDSIINKDGETFIVDFDNDGDFDICVIGITHSLNNYTHSHTLDIYVWDGQTSQLIAHSPLTVNGEWGASIPYSGDLNGDGFPEIIFAVTEIGMLAYTYDTTTFSMSLMHNHAPFGETSGFTVFDFNQDGRNEIVYRGTHQLFIVDGVTLENLSEPITAYSGTVTEYPVVADVNADGHAEIIVTRAYGDWFTGSSANGWVSVYGSQIPGAWSSARKVWNQWAYNSVNINEDMTVPQHQFNISTTFPNGKKPFNSFLRQMPYIDSQGDLFNAVADVAVSGADAVVQNDTVLLSITYCNTGDNALFAPYNVAIFANAYGGDTVCTVTMNESLPVDSCNQGDIRLTISSLCSFQSLDSLVIAVNCAGTGIAQNGGQQPECDTTNNTAAVAISLHTDTTHLTASACDSYLWYGDTLTQSGTYTHTFTNVTGCDSVEVLVLTVNATSENTLSVIGVENNLPYIFNGISYSVPGTYYQHFTNAAGCDSTLVIQLTVFYNQTVEVDSTLCEDALPIIWNDSVFEAAGTKTRIYPAANGADSIVVMTLHVNPNPTAVISGLTALCADSVVTLTADSAYSYSWSTGDTTRSINTSAPGVYALTVTNQHGCEAQTIHFLTLLDNPILSVTVPEMCAGGSYTLSVGHQNTDNIHLAQGDTTLAPQAVTFEFDYSTADGLWLTTLSDSLFQINPPADLEHDTAIAYTFTVYDSIGCGYDTTVSITFRATRHTEMDTVVCVSFEWGDSVYTQSGQYVQHLTSAVGCDSVSTLNLTVNMPTDTTIAVTVLENNLPYVLNDSSYYDPGTYEQNLENALGCDSTITIDLTVLYNVTTNLDTTVCDNELPLLWNGFSCDSAGVYTSYQTSANGTDSTVYLTLTVNPTSENTLSVIGVENNLPYIFNGISYSVPGTYYQHFTNAAGCDSTLIIQLTVYYNQTVEVDSTICEDALPITWNDSVFETAGTKTRIYPAANGADSIVVMTLHVNPNPTAAISGLTALCSDSLVALTADSAYSYLWSNGDTTRIIYVSESGEYTLTVTNQYGCEATASHLLMPLNNPIISVTVPEMCAGGSYTLSVGHQNIDNIHLGQGETTLSMTETIYLPDGVYCEPSGCSYRSPLTFTAYAPGDTIQSADDIYYVRLNMEHSYIGDLYINITCPNGQKADLLKYGGSGTSDCNSQISASSRGWASGSNVPGYIYLGNAYDYDVSSCDPSAFGNEPGVGWNYCWSNNTTQGYVYSSGEGGYIYRLANVPNTSLGNKIDSSNVSAGTQFYHPDDSFSNLIGCPLNGSWYIEVQDGWSEDNGYIFGWELSLSSEMLPDMTFEFDYSTSDGPWITTLSDSLFQINPPANLGHDTIIAYTFTVYDSAGCGYDTTVYITIKAARHTEFDTVVCDSFTWNDSVYTQSGQYVQYLLCENGCDSVVTCQLTVNHAVSGNETLNLVQNQLPYTVVPANTTFTMQSPLVSNISYTLTSAAGCDSLVNLTVYIYHNVAHQVDTTVCASALPFTWHGHTFTAAGNHTVTLLTSHGADSVVTYHLSVINLSANVGNVTHITCYGASTGAATATVTGGQAPMTYAWTNASGANVSTTTSISNRPAGTYTFTVTDHLGCTATTTVTLNTLNGELAPGTIAADQQVCDGANAEPFTGTAASGGDNGAYQWQISTNGTDWTPAPGTTNAQNYTYPNPVSNDFSLRRAWVSQTCGTVYSNTVTVTFWPNSLDTITAEICLGNPYQENGFNITPDQTGQVGEYTFEQHYSSGFCDSAVVLLLTVNPLGATTIEDEVCEGAGYSGQGFWVSPMETVGVDSVSKTVNLQNVYGCDSVVTLRLSVIDTGLRVVSLTTDFCEDQSAELMVVTDMTNYVWSTGETAPTILVTAPGHYTVEAYQGECHNTAYFNVAGCPTEFQLPNTITPSNGDGLNDYFYIPESYQKDMALFEIAIFNRWGEMVFYSTNKNFQWNGEYRGDIQYQTIYNYIINYSDHAGRPHRVTGSITVL